MDDVVFKINGIEFFPPVETFDEALKIYIECGGMIISLEDNKYLVDEPVKIMKLYSIPKDDLILYFKQCLVENNVETDEIELLLSQWKEEVLANI